MTSTQASANRILIWMCVLIAVNYAADVAPARMNAAAISSYRMLSDLGYVIGPIALGAAADLFGADATLGVTALLLVVVSLVFWRLAPESFRPSGI
jgi:hypothetical protein